MSPKFVEVIDFGNGLLAELAGLPALMQSLPLYSLSESSTQALDFGPEPGYVRTLDFRVPWQPGMDALHVVRAGVRITAKAVRLDPALLGGANGPATLELPAGNGRYPDTAVDAELEEVRIRGLQVSGASDLDLASGASRAIRFRPGEAPILTNAPGKPYLHFLLRLDGGGGFGPPAAAFPQFSMPGGSGLYGPALAGGTIHFTQRPDGRVDVSLRTTPMLRARKLQLTLVKVEGDHVTRYDRGLPHEGSVVSWSAEEIEAIWKGGLQAVTVDAYVGDEAGAAPVSSFPGSALQSGAAEPHDNFIDFSAAARSLLRSAHEARRDADGSASASADDLALTVRFDAHSRGRLLYRDFEVVAEYRRFPGRDFADEAPALSLRGNPLPVRLQLPAGLRPARATLTLDGSYGRHVLIPASDRGSLQPQEIVHGYRLRGSTRVARWIPLPGVPDTLPPRPLLTRVGVEGRAAGPCELLLALHRGAPGFIGPRIGDPVALSIDSELRPRWHRAELGREARAASRLAGLTGVWVVAEVSEGSFWWSARMPDGHNPDQDQDQDQGPTHCLLSEAGGTWDARPGWPRLQVHHELVAGEPGLPIPEPIEFYVNWGSPQAPAWSLLRADLRPPAIAQDDQFRSEGVAPFGIRGLSKLVKGKAKQVLPLDRLGDLQDGVLEIGFDCVRDVDFRLLDLAFTYSPWLANEP